MLLITDCLNEFFKSLVIFRKDHPTQQELSLIPEIIDRIFAANCQNFIDATQAFKPPETFKFLNEEINFLKTVKIDDENKEIVEKYNSKIST